MTRPDRSLPPGRPSTGDLLMSAHRSPPHPDGLWQDGGAACPPCARAPMSRTSRALSGTECDFRPGTVREWVDYPHLSAQHSCAGRVGPERCAPMPTGLAHADERQGALVASIDETGPLIGGLLSQVPDIDPAETGEWLESLDGLIDDKGGPRARYVMLSMLRHA